MNNTIYEKQIYTLGFVFNQNKDYVILIEKQKPAWQAGYYNGIGGKYNPDDIALINTMIREAKEEIGIITQPDDWTQFAELFGADFLIHCYYLVNDDIFTNAESKESEKIYKIKISDLTYYRIIPNLSWLIPLALDSSVKNNMTPYATVKYTK
jgi:8-oxo-dGTP diphosphatase